MSSQDVLFPDSLFVLLATRPAMSPVLYKDWGAI